MLNRRVGNTGSEPGPGPGLSMGPRGRVLDNRPPIDRSGGAPVGPAGPAPVMPTLPDGPRPRGMKKGGKVGSSCMKKGGSVKSKPMAKYASGGMVKADGCAMRGKTKGKNC